MTHLLLLRLVRHDIDHGVVLNPKIAELLVVALQGLPIAEALEVGGAEVGGGGAGRGFDVLQAQVLAGQGDATAPQCDGVRLKGRNGMEQATKCCVRMVNMRKVKQHFTTSTSRRKKENFEPCDSRGKLLGLRSQSSPQRLRMLRTSR